MEKDIVCMGVQLCGWQMNEAICYRSILKLAVVSSTIGPILRVQRIGTGRAVDLDDPAIDQGHLNGEGGVEASLALQFILPHACIVVHVQTHTHELLLQTADDVHVAPSLPVTDPSAPVVNFQDHLINPPQISHRESPEARPLGTLHVDLHTHMLASQVPLADHIGQREESH